MKAIQSKLGNIRMIIGVDRLDYIKGVPNKLMAFDLFLSKYPQFQKQVSLVQVAVPTRTDVDEYQNLKVTVDGLIGLINGKYGKIQVARHGMFSCICRIGSADYTPIHFIYRSVDFVELVSLYKLSDICIVSSTRDGMNLV
jgi:trehalose-6-phosphate synthase